MTQFRTPISLAAVTGALLFAACAVSAAIAPAHAYYNRIAFGYATTTDGKNAAADLPAPPAVAAPQPKAPGQGYQHWRQNLGTPGSTAGHDQTVTIGGAQSISVGGAQAPKPDATLKMQKAR